MNLIENNGKIVSMETGLNWKRVSQIRNGSISNWKSFGG
jgi:hypothetical protein